MNFDPSDILFLAIVLWIAVVLLSGSGGGGLRSRIPVPI
jgi:hypothetical protein